MYYLKGMTTKGTPKTKGSRVRISRGFFFIEYSSKWEICHQFLWLPDHTNFFFRKSNMWERGVCKKRKIKATRVRVIAPAIINATPKPWFVYSSRKIFSFF